MGKWKESDPSGSPLSSQNNSLDVEFTKLLCGDVQPHTSRFKTHQRKIHSPPRSSFSSHSNKNRNENKKSNEDPMFNTDADAHLNTNQFPQLNSSSVISNVGVWQKNSGVSVLKSCPTKKMDYSSNHTQTFVHKIKNLKPIIQPKLKPTIPQVPLCAKIFFPEYFGDYNVYKRLYLLDC